MGWIIDELKKSPRRSEFGYPGGSCAHCGKTVYEAGVILDDAYACWAGKCPYCEGINLLSLNHGRGYNAKQMWLVKPTHEEIKEHPCLGAGVLDNDAVKGREM